MTAHRIITNSRPHDYRSGIEPTRPLWRSHWREVVGVAFLIGAVFGGVSFALGIVAGWAS